MDRNLAAGFDPDAEWADGRRVLAGEDMQDIGEEEEDEEDGEAGGALSSSAAAEDADNADGRIDVFGEESDEVSTVRPGYQRTAGFGKGIMGLNKAELFFAKRR